MDAYGHVNNVNFLRYLEDARVDFMFTRAENAGVPGFSSGTVIARHEIDYLRPLVYRPAPVTVEIWVTGIRPAAFTVAYEVKDVAEDGGETLYVRASSVLVPYHLEDARPRRLTPEERAYLEPYLDGAAVAA